MNKPETEISDVHRYKPAMLSPPMARVNLVELKELVGREYTQRQIASFTSRFSNKAWRKSSSHSQVNKFLNGTLPTSSIDFNAIKRTLEWLMGVEIIQETIPKKVTEGEY